MKFSLMHFTLMIPFLTPKILKNKKFADEFRGYRWNICLKSNERRLWHLDALQSGLKIILGQKLFVIVDCERMIWSILSKNLRLFVVFLFSFIPALWNIYLKLFQNQTLLITKEIGYYGDSFTAWKCPNTEFFLVHIFLYLDWIQKFGVNLRIQSKYR